MTANPIPCVLHVDDDPSDTLLMQQACRKAGVSFQLQSVSDGEAAIAYLSGVGVYADREHHRHEVQSREKSNQGPIDREVVHAFLPSLGDGGCRWRATGCPRGQRLGPMR